MKKVKLFLLLLAVVAMLVPFVLPSSVVYADEDILFGETFYVEASVEWLLDLLIEGGHFESALEEFGSLDALLLALADVEFVEVREILDPVEVVNLHLPEELEFHFLEQVNLMSDEEFFDYIHNFIMEYGEDSVLIGDGLDAIDFEPFNSHMDPATGRLCNGRISSSSTRHGVQSHSHSYDVMMYGFLVRVTCNYERWATETHLSCDTCSWTARIITVNEGNHTRGDCPW